MPEKKIIKLCSASRMTFWAWFKNRSPKYWRTIRNTFRPFEKHFSKANEPKKAPKYISDRKVSGLFLRNEHQFKTKPKSGAPYIHIFCWYLLIRENTLIISSHWIKKYIFMSLLRIEPYSVMWQVGIFPLGQEHWHYLKKLILLLISFPTTR